MIVELCQTISYCTFITLQYYIISFLHLQNLMKIQEAGGSSWCVTNAGEMSNYISLTSIASDYLDTSSIGL